MAAESLPVSRKKRTVSQKRVAVVLASLVGTLTLSCGLLILMENRPLTGSAQMLAATGEQDWSAVSNPHAGLQSDRWNYIIVYESGDAADCAASLADGRGKGVRSENVGATRQPANFHFVIDGTGSGVRRGSAVDGYLEVGSAWLEQNAGAPYAGWPDSRYNNHYPYKNAIGVCLAADLTRGPISEQQTQTLVQLTTELQHLAKLPSQRVFFQWELGPNARHATPAQIAFAERFRRRLD